MFLNHVSSKCGTLFTCLKNLSYSNSRATLALFHNQQQQQQLKLKHPQVQHQQQKRHMISLTNADSRLLSEPNRSVLNQQMKQINYNANDLWKSVLLVSTQGSKKGRGKRRGASGKSKDLNMGQTLGDGKLQVKWPGLNAEVIQKVKPNEARSVKPETKKIQIVGVDESREKNLTEIRNRMDKFKRVTVFPQDRGFTSSSLKGKFLGPPTSYSDVDFSEFDSCIINYRFMISHKSKLGKKKVVSIFIITGNKKGVFGFAEGSSSTAAGAIAKAKGMASKNLLNFNLYEDRTLFHDIYEQYYYTKVFAKKVPKGHGITGHRVIQRICKLIGIKDLYAKVEGSRNATNVAKAFICGLLNQKSYESIAQEKNLYLVEFKPERGYFPEILASPLPSAQSTSSSTSSSASTTKNNSHKNEKTNENDIENDLSSILHLDTSDEEYMRRLMHHEKENDLKLYLFNNRFMHEKKHRKPFYANYPSYLKYCELRDKDMMLQEARIDRIKSLSEEEVNMSKYPLLPKPIRRKLRDEKKAQLMAKVNKNKSDENTSNESAEVSS